MEQRNRSTENHPTKSFKTDAVGDQVRPTYLADDVNLKEIIGTAAHSGRSIVINIDQSHHHHQIENSVRDCFQPILAAGDLIANLPINEADINSNKGGHKRPVPSDFDETIPKKVKKRNSNETPFQADEPRIQLHAVTTNLIVQKMKSNPVSRDLLNTCIDVYNCDSDHIAVRAANNFPTEARLSDTFMSINDAYALSHVIKRVDKRIKTLNLSGCHLDSETFLYIKKAIASMPGSIECLNISDNHLSSKDIDGICTILYKIKDKLWMWDCISDDDGKQRNILNEEKERIQRKLNCLLCPNLKVYFEPFAKLTETVASKFSSIHKYEPIGYKHI